MIEKLFKRNHKQELNLLDSRKQPRNRRCDVTPIFGEQNRPEGSDVNLQQCCMGHAMSDTLILIVTLELGKVA